MDAKSRRIRSTFTGASFESGFFGLGLGLAAFSANSDVSVPAGPGVGVSGGDSTGSDSAFVFSSAIVMFGWAASTLSLAVAARPAIFGGLGTSVLRNLM